RFSDAAPSHEIGARGGPGVEIAAHRRWTGAAETGTADSRIEPVRVRRVPRRPPRCPGSIGSGGDLCVVLADGRNFAHAVGSDGRWLAGDCNPRRGEPGNRGGRRDGTARTGQQSRTTRSGPYPSRPMSRTVATLGPGRPTARGRAVRRSTDGGRIRNPVRTAP